MRPCSAPALSDDLEFAGLAAAVRSQAQRVRVVGNGSRLVFGTRTLSRDEYAFGLETFARLAEGASDKQAFFAEVRRLYDFYEVYGGDGWGEVLVTSYYEPEIRGSRKKTKELSQPLMRAPSDLVEVAISKYDDRFAEVGTMRGRLIASANGPGKLQLVPYYSREEIDGGALARRGLELAYVDPIDAFFLQIQGSGTIVLDDGARLRVGYSEQNGHKYESIGRFLTDVISKDKITLMAIESYLRSMPVEKARGILQRNPSFVFFSDRGAGAPLTMLGTPVVPGRTIATDTRYFQKGTLAFLVFEQPRFADAAANEPSAWEKTSRFVVDDDTGGAIRGGGRVDLFWGAGAEARRYAGVMKAPGRLVYLVPGEELLKRIAVP